MAAKLLSAQEVADYLDVPLATVYSLNSSGRGPRRVRVGRNIRYKIEDVESWVESQAVVSRAAE